VPGVPVLVMATSAAVNAPENRTVAVDELGVVLGFGSGVLDEMVAVLKRKVSHVPPAPTVTVIMKFAVSPFAIVALVKVTVPLLPAGGVAGVHPDGAAAATKVMPSGNPSVTITLDAVRGPLLTTLSVYVKVTLLLMGTTVISGVLVIPRSAVVPWADTTDRV